eukprot:sb/3470472/
MRRLKFVLIGHPQVGRTTLLETYVNGAQFMRSDSGTLARGSSRPRSFMMTSSSAVSFNINVVVDGTPFSLRLYDPDMEDLESVLGDEMPDAVIILFDISNLESFQVVEELYRRVKLKSPKMKIVVAGNKLDLRIRNPQRLPLVTVQEVKDMAMRLRTREMVECSGMTLRGVDDLFDSTVRFAAPAMSELKFRLKRRSRADCSVM